MKKVIWLPVLILLLASCQEEERRDGVLIVCTTGFIGDAVRQITDSTCVVKSLMGPGTDPHLFKPTKTTLDLLADADIVVANGLHLEGRMQDILEKIENRKSVVFLGDYLPEEALIYGDESGSFPDPHIWFDVNLWRTALEGAAKEIGPCVNQDRATNYFNALEDLDSWVKAEISSIPLEKRVLITAHDAFSYFGRAYDIEVVGLQGISTVAEYGVRDISNMVELILERRIPAIFVESSVSSRSIEAVMAGVRSRDFDIKEGGVLYSDAMGPEGSRAGTYVGMVEHNVNTITKALQ